MLRFLCAKLCRHVALSDSQVSVLMGLKVSCIVRPMKYVWVTGLCSSTRVIRAESSTAIMEILLDRMAVAP